MWGHLSYLFQLQPWTGTFTTLCLTHNLSSWLSVNMKLHIQNGPLSYHKPLSLWRLYRTPSSCDQTPVSLLKTFLHFLHACPQTQFPCSGWVQVSPWAGLHQCFLCGSPSFQHPAPIPVLVSYSYCKGLSWRGNLTLPHQWLKFSAQGRIHIHSKPGLPHSALGLKSTFLCTPGI